MSEPILADVCEGAYLRLSPENRQRLLALIGKVVEIQPKRKTRSLDQNAWIWGVAYPLIAEHLGYDRHEHDELHYALLAECFGRRHNEQFAIDVPNVRSSRMTTKEFSDYMEWLVRFAAQTWDVVIPLPDEEAA